MNEFKRLLRYAAPYRGRLVVAVIAMIVYAAGSVGLARLIQPIYDDVLSLQQHVAASQHPDPRRVLREGARLVRLGLRDDRRRPARRARPPEPALRSHPRSVRGVLFAPDVRTVDLADHERRQPDPAGRVRDAGGLDPRIDHGRGLRRLPVLSRLASGARLHDGRAARRVPAGPARAARAADDAPRSGTARARHASCRRGVHGTPHRQGVRRGSARDGAVQPGVGDAVPHEHADHGRAVGPAAADGVHRRDGRGRRAVVRLARDRDRPAHRRASSPRFWPRRS